MRNVTLILICSCMSSLVACHNADRLSKEKMLQALLDQKEYFKLNSALSKEGDGISDEKKLYFEATLDNVFNRNSASNEKINSLLQQFGSGLPDSVKAGLLMLQTDNYFKTFEYARAAAIDSELIAHYRAAVDSSTYEDIKNMALIHKGLASIPPQQTTIPSTTSIPWKRDRLGLMEIAIRRNQTVYQSIFDTRANISSISATYARKLGLKMLDVSYNEISGATGNLIRSSLAIADSLMIGGILVRNAVFQVMPDEALYIAPLHFSLDIIIGYPVIAQLREIHILRNGTMTIPATLTGSDLHNLALDGLDPIVSCVAGEDTLCFQFDTGASATDLYYVYFTRNKAYILRHGKVKKQRVAGAAGIADKNIYVLDSLRFRVGSGQALLTNVSVQAEPDFNGAGKYYYGNMGQDVIGQFNELILNFDSMYLDFK